MRFNEFSFKKCNFYWNVLTTLENSHRLLNIDDDHDQDSTLNFNTIRTTFKKWKTISKFYLDPQTSSKIILSTGGTDRKTDKQKLKNECF